MKKYIAIIVSVISIFCLTGCQNTVNASEVYSFPEPTVQITGSFYS